MKAVVFVVGYLILAPFVGAVLDGADRVITARMQGRRGPSVLQPFYDLSKLFSKQMIAVNNVQLLLNLSYLVFIVIAGSMLFGGGGHPDVPVYPLHGGHVPGDGRIQRFLPFR